MVTIALLLTKSGRDAGGSRQQFPRYSTWQASHPVRCGQQVPGTLTRGITPRSFEVGWPECVWHRWIILRDPDEGSDDRDDMRLARKEETFFISEVKSQEQGQATDVESISQPTRRNQRLAICAAKSQCCKSLKVQDAHLMVQLAARIRVLLRPSLTADP